MVSTRSCYYVMWGLNNKQDTVTKKFFIRPMSPVWRDTGNSYTFHWYVLYELIFCYVKFNVFLFLIVNATFFPGNVLCQLVKHCSTTQFISFGIVFTNDEAMSLAKVLLTCSLIYSFNSLPHWSENECSDWYSFCRQIINLCYVYVYVMLILFPIDLKRNAVIGIHSFRLSRAISFTCINVLRFGFLCRYWSSTGSNRASSTQTTPR